MSKTPDTGWYYWEAGSLVSLLAMACSHADSPAQLAYGLLVILFLFGMTTGWRSGFINQEIA